MNIITTKNIEQANVVTHSGVFHADEVLGTVILSKVLDNVSVLRTFKVPQDLKKDVIVYDIGFGQFDHHQKGGNGARANGVPYAAVGLLWKEFGPEIVANTADPELVWNLIDRDLIQGVDANDNGVLPMADYPAQAENFSHIIYRFNPNWDSTESEDDAFIRAVEFAEVVFDNFIAEADSKAKARKIVEEAIEQADGHIAVLNQYVPWQEFILTSENEKAKDIQFVIFPSNRGGFNWQCVPDAIGSFGQRKAVPQEWRGLNDEALQKVTGVETATFCHPAGFIGGADKFLDAVQLATMAVEYKG